MPEPDESPEERLLSALNQLGFEDEHYDTLAEAVENLLDREDGLAAIIQKPGGPSVHDFSNSQLTVLIRLFETMKKSIYDANATMTIIDDLAGVLKK